MLCITSVRPPNDRGSRLRTRHVARDSCRHCDGLHPARSESREPGGRFEVKGGERRTVAHSAAQPWSICWRSQAFSDGLAGRGRLRSGNRVGRGAFAAPFSEVLLCSPDHDRSGVADSTSESGGPTSCPAFSAIISAAVRTEYELALLEDGFAAHLR